MVCVSFHGVGLLLWADAGMRVERRSAMCENREKYIFTEEGEDLRKTKILSD
jgi:hypothetical protein